MNVAVFKEANKIWNRIAMDENVESLQFSLEVHQRLLSFFQVGDYYYYIFNVKKSAFEFISKDIFPVLGYLPEEIDVKFFLESIHPDDQPWFLNFEKKVAEFFATLTAEQIPNYKVRYDYRVRKKNGEYIRILQQVVTIQFSKNERVLRTFGVHTDITHIKNSGLPSLSFIGLHGEPSYIDVPAKQKYLVAKALLTRREQQVLSLLVEGKNSQEISSILFISKLTVDSHRKNLLRKAMTKNTAELINVAIKKGWV